MLATLSAYAHIPAVRDIAKLVFDYIKPEYAVSKLTCMAILSCHRLNITIERKMNQRQNSQPEICARLCAHRGSRDVTVIVRENYPGRCVTC
jgi:hypothetical protein